jgi:MFS family permease
METAAAAAVAPQKHATPMRTVVIASSAGTAFEWYDFFVYGSLTQIISRKFFAHLDPTSGTLAALALFAAGLLFRPVGALVFGRIGDRYGRKGAFLATVIIMGGATFAIGLLPPNEAVGGMSTILLIVLRILQGLAVGGEYGGAAIYVAEHCEPHHRGAMTGWIQSSAAFGLAGALGIVLLTRTLMGEEVFSDWGWRVPFLASIFLLGISIWMRLKLKESPAFEQMKAEGNVSKAPYAEVFLKWSNMRLVLLALFSFLLSQGAIWWCAFFYSQIFLESFVKLPAMWGNIILIGATFVSIPLYVFFGWLSDRVGRKPVLLFGMVLALVAMFPAFKMLAGGANNALLTAQEQSPVEVHADPMKCSFQFDLLGRNKYETGCDIARNVLTKAGAAFKTVGGATGDVATVHIGGAVVEAGDGLGLTTAELTAHAADIDKRIKVALVDAGYPPEADVSAIDWLPIVTAMIVLVIAATALYGPMAAALVELFPTRVRYTALSVPYHIGVGWTGGLMPMTAFAIAAATGDIFAGLWYPVVFAAIGVVCCFLFFPETKGRPLT